MPILSPVGRKSWSQRLAVFFIYGVLTFFGATMAIPCLITLTSSTANDFDYDRYSIIPRFLWSKEDRFVKGIVDFINRYPNWYQALQDQFPGAPATWTSWRVIGLDHEGTDRLARAYLDAAPAEREIWKREAADYCAFAQQYPVADCLCTFTPATAAEFIGLRYKRLWGEQHPDASGKPGVASEADALGLLSETWGVPITSFLAIRFSDMELRAPLGQQSWVPPLTPKQSDYEVLKSALQHGYGIPGAGRAWERYLEGKGMSSEQAEANTPLAEDAPASLAKEWVEFASQSVPASPVIPFPMRMYWITYLGSDEVRTLLNVAPAESFDVAHYNTLAGTHYATLRDTPFPLPAQGFEGLRPIWKKFVETRYPLRLTKIDVTPELLAAYHQFLHHYPSLGNLNQFVGASYADWNDFPLAAEMPKKAGTRAVWMDFVKKLPAEQRLVSSSESSYQAFLLERYGTLAAVNAAYGWNLACIEEARPPFDKAYTETYLQHQTAFAWSPVLQNYHTIGKFLIRQSNAVPVTLWLIVLSIFMTLTVNPIAGYALSRFNLKSKDKIILFCLATSAFPAVVSAIPGYLLMRDLGLLNTFFALVLPGAANGMSIFILKGFFDSLPAELYEAATIDGAKEWQIFSFVTLPMVKPIMAINALNAFIGAYSGWEWALIICQNPRMWTFSVWLYQASQWWGGSPWIISAGFVIASIPILLVFLFCQNIILRGIIVPSMK